jgi:DNA-binding MarR family transcriptional regulator
MADETTQTGERFIQLMNRLRKLGTGNAASGNTQISPAQMSLLDWVAASNGCGVQNIANGLNLTPPTVSVGVRRLEEAGFIKRESNPQDKRSVQFFPTRRGQALQRQFQNAHRNKFRLLLAGLTPQEQEMFLGLLEKALNAAEPENSGSVD